MINSVVAETTTSHSVNVCITSLTTLSVYHVVPTFPVSLIRPLDLSINGQTNNRPSEAEPSIIGSMTTATGGPQWMQNRRVTCGFHDYYGDRRVKQSLTGSMARTTETG